MFRFLAKLVLFLSMAAAPCFAGTVNVNCTSPAQNSTVSTKPTFTCSATTTGGAGITGWNIYDGSTSIWSTPGPTASISATPANALSTGTHTLNVRAWDSQGGFSTYVYTLNVSSTGGIVVTPTCTLPGATSPTNVQFICTASTNSGFVTGWKIYIDNVDSGFATTASTNPSISTTVNNVAAGSHAIVVRAWNNLGNSGDWNQTLTVSTSSVVITPNSPLNGATYTSPVAFSASASSTSGSITSWTVFIDGANKGNFSPNSSTLTTSMTLANGSHQFDIRATDSAGKTADYTGTMGVGTTTNTGTVTSNHVVVLMEENRSYDAALQYMTYLKGLAAQYSQGSQFYSDMHGSWLAYGYLTSGQNLSNMGCSGGGCGSTVNVPNIVRQLNTDGKTWKGYFDALPYAGYMGGDSGEYAIRHNPFVYYSDVVNDKTEQQNMVTFTQLNDDLSRGILPNYSWIVPAVNDDAHDPYTAGTDQTALTAADQWLQNQALPEILKSPFFQPGGDGVLIITFDEGSITNPPGIDNACSSTVSNGCGGHVWTVVIGPNVKTQFTTSNHYMFEDILKSTCDLLKLSACPGAGATAKGIGEFFQYPVVVGGGGGGGTSGGGGGTGNTSGLPPLPIYLYAHFHDDDQSLYLSYSTDGVNFTPVKTSASLVGPVIRDPSVTYVNGAFQFVTTGNQMGKFQYFSSADLVHFSSVTNVDLTGAIPGANYVWAPEFFADDNGSTYVTVAVSTDSGNTFTPYIMTFNNGTFGAPFAMTLNGTTRRQTFDYFIKKKSGTYYMYYADEVIPQAPYIQDVTYATSTNLTGPYTQAVPGDYYGFGAASEAPSLLDLPSGCTRLYADVWTLDTNVPCVTTFCRFYRVKYEDMCQFPLSGAAPQYVNIDSTEHGTILVVKDQTEANLVFSAAGLIPAGGTSGGGGTGMTLTYSTDLTTETSNNTSASSSFAGTSNGDPTPRNVSKVDTHTLLYPGATTYIFPHVEPWFCTSGSICNGHVNVGYNSDDQTQANKIVADAYSRGFNGTLTNWYGWPHGGTTANCPHGTYHCLEDNASKEMLKATESYCTNGACSMTFHIDMDQGSLTGYCDGNNWQNNGFSSVQNCIIGYFNTAMDYLNQNYWSSPAYLRVSVPWLTGARPIMSFFMYESGFAIDWNYTWNQIYAHAKTESNANGGPIFYFENDPTHYGVSNGEFDWVPINTSNANDWGKAHIDWFHNSFDSQDSSKWEVAATWKGFNDTIASWSQNRVVNQNCGQTWLNSWAEITAGGFHSATKPLDMLQIVTWSDYDEGSEAETGIDPCNAITGTTINGGVVSWSITGAKNTVDHYTVYASKTNTGNPSLAVIADNIAPDPTTGAASFNAANYAIPAGTYYFYAKMVAKPGLFNSMSPAMGPYTTGGGCTANCGGGGSNPPQGQFESLTQSAGQWTATGWAADPQDGAPVGGNITLSVDGQPAGQATTGIARPDIATAYPGENPSWLNSGWSFSGLTNQMTQAPHTISVVAYDSSGAYTILGTKTLDLTTVAPTCTLSVSPTTGQTPLAVSAFAQCGGQNTITSITIDFGDGTTVNSSSTVHSYTATGTFIVTVTATDSKGLSASARANVTTSSVPLGTAVVVTTPANGAKVYSPVRVQATATVVNGPVTDFRIVLDGITVLDVTDGTSVLDKYVFMSVGTHVIQVQATDANGVQFGQTMTVQAVNTQN